MAQNDAFYRHATSGYGEIVNLDVIQTLRTRESGYLYDSRWYKPIATQKPSFLDTITASDVTSGLKTHFLQSKMTKM